MLADQEIIIGLRGSQVLRVILKDGGRSLRAIQVVCTLVLAQETFALNFIEFLSAGFLD